MDNEERIWQLHVIIEALQYLTAGQGKDAIPAVIQKLDMVAAFPGLSKEIESEFQKGGNALAIQRLLTKAHDLSEPAPTGTRG